MHRYQSGLMAESAKLSIRWFESSPMLHFTVHALFVRVRPLNQLLNRFSSVGLEHWPTKPTVGGSSPSGGTMLGQLSVEQAVL